MYIDLLTIPQFTLGAWAKGAKLSFGTGEVIFMGVDLASRLKFTKDLQLEQETVIEILVDQAAFLAGYYYAPRQFNYYGWVTIATLLAFSVTKKSDTKSKESSEEFILDSSESADWEWDDGN